MRSSGEFLRVKSSASTSHAEATSHSAARRRAGWLLLTLIPLPSLGVLAAMAFPCTRGTLPGQILYGMAKIALLAVPIFIYLKGKSPGQGLFSTETVELRKGILWGLALMVTVCTAFASASMMNLDLSLIRAAAHQNGLTSLPRFLLLALYLSFLNSLAEEFIWRYFLFTQWRHFCSKPVAIILTNLAFTLHHLLALLFQTHLWLALLGAASVFSAGCLWSWLFVRKNNLTAAYISHIAADLAIFGWAGWFIYLT